MRRARDWLRFWLWLRPVAWWFRFDVYIDCRKGRDGNWGDKHRPLKTMAELNRRMHGRMLRGDLRIHIVDAIEDDELQINVTFAPGVRIVFDGCWLNPRPAPV